MRPTRRARDLGEDIGPAGTPRREREHVLLDELRIREKLPDHVRMWIAKKTLHHLAIRFSRERLALTERQRPSAAVIGDAIVLRRRHVARRNDGDWLPNETLEREVWNADRFFSQP